MSLDIVYLDSAAMIPAGARVAATSWHVAGLYGPGEPHTTERDALVEAIATAERFEARTAGYARPTIDLRWKMEWPQGSLDPNGRPVHASGLEFTVRRTRYRSLTEAREHLTRIDTIYEPPGSIPGPLRNGDTVTIEHTINLTEP